MTSEQVTATLPSSVLQKATTQKEIASAMMRLGADGLNVPVNINDLKKLPKIPNTGARVLKKKGVTDLGSAMVSLDEVDEESQFGRSKGYGTMNRSVDRSAFTAG